jgi:hypothetical protein
MTSTLLFRELKLKIISENTPDRMQKFCINVILDAIDKKIEDLTKCNYMISYHTIQYHFMLVTWFTINAEK